MLTGRKKPHYNCRGAFTYEMRQLTTNKTSKGNYRLIKVILDSTLLSLHMETSQQNEVIRAHTQSRLNKKKKTATDAVNKAVKNK